MTYVSKVRLTIENRLKDGEKDQVRGPWSREVAVQLVRIGTSGKPFNEEPVGCTDRLNVRCGTKEKDEKDSQHFSLSNDHLLS